MHHTAVQTLEEHGYRGRVVPIHRLDELRTEIEGRYGDGSFSDDFSEYLGTELTFELPPDVERMRSLIIVAAGHPQTRFTFGWKGSRVPLVVPPTYLHWRRVEDRIADLLRGVVEPHGYRISRGVVPKKLLAVRSGLADYGTNNITFVPGMGSFVGLAAFFSDMPCGPVSWRRPKMLDRCAECRACLNACPAEAISRDRFLLHAERCLTFHNEQPDTVPFPSWLDPSWHGCVVGCMICQRVCPENKEVLGRIEEGAEFSAQETDLLLQGAGFDDLPARTKQKLAGSDLARMADLLPRNLGALLDCRFHIAE